MAFLVGLCAAFVFLFPVGTDIELVKRVDTATIEIVEHREVWSIGTVFVTDAVLGRTHLDRYTVPFGFVATVAIAGVAYGVRALTFGR